jgi:hypothetical protein
MMHSMPIRHDIDAVYILDGGVGGA